MSLETGKTPEVVASARKKLLVLDVNGFLIDTYHVQSRALCPVRPHDSTVNRLFVYNRPFCDDFLQFCLDHFVVGVWSSARKNNVQAFVEYIFKEAKEKLAFVWHQEHCTSTGFSHPDNHNKPVFLKELSKLWGKLDPNLPWEADDYGPSNTLLIDDSPSKAIKNPPHTAIFPKTYNATNSEDDYLGRDFAKSRLDMIFWLTRKLFSLAGKELRIYLQGLLQMADVQAYVLENPIGEPSITVGDPRWSKIVLSLKTENGNEQSVQEVPPFRSAKGGIRGSLHERGENALRPFGNEGKELEQNVRLSEDRPSVSGGLERLPS